MKGKPVDRKGVAGATGEVRDGDYCRVTGGVHAGKMGLVKDAKRSATGHLTITVEQDSGVCFKTLARNVTAEPRPQR